ncbi:HAD hydrolase-like protein [Lacrimispora sp.]|uniref:HAD family hydrolase n=1 Tax=Lacrimispora sp. TaxID=2719234 RepID=UPI0032E48F83
MQDIENYQKRKQFLVCVDSDGCAMDTMDIKHKKCFGPCLIEVWNLQQWEEEILDRWYEINLYSELRGINRFKGLAIALKEINEKYIVIEALESFLNWVEETKELSNESLMEQISKNKTVCLEKALQWSDSLNKKIKDLLPQEKIPFKNVKEVLKRVHQYADIAIVSSANYEAVREEWSENGLLDHIDLLLSQNIGSKSHCIHELLGKGYDTNQVIMIGDAPGDEKAAEENQVLFYPILVKQEAESWNEFSEHVFGKFLQQDFREDSIYYKNKFYNNFIQKERG